MPRVRVIRQSRLSATCVTSCCNAIVEDTAKRCPTCRKRLTGKDEAATSTPLPELQQAPANEA
jgi:hypothetical protein